MSAAYDSYNYQSYWKGRDYEHESEVFAIESFLKKIPREIDIIDIGCGFGRLAPLYLGKANSVLLADSSKKCLSEAKDSFGGDPRIKFLLTNAQNLPNKIGGRKFDLALVVRVVHHVEDLDSIISSANKVLKKNGYLILEFANKLHIKAVINNFIKGNLTFPLEILPTDKRTKKNKKKACIPFLNFHPDYVKKVLEQNKFKILEKRSVSNVRSKSVKKYLPHFVMTAFERTVQKSFAKLYFGPSMFVLARKVG